MEQSPNIASKSLYVSFSLYLVTAFLFSACQQSFVQDEESHLQAGAQGPLTQNEEAGPLSEFFLDAEGLRQNFGQTLELERSSPVMQLAAPASRVTVWLSQSDAVSPTLWAQAGFENGQTGVWEELEEIFREGEHIVYAADLNTLASTLQIKASSLQNTTSMRFAANLPLAENLRSEVLDEIPLPQSLAPIADRASYNAAPARCSTGSLDTPRGLWLQRIPSLDGQVADGAFLRALQAFDQLGLLWCDTRSHFLLSQAGTVELRGSRVGEAEVLAPNEQPSMRLGILGCYTQTLPLAETLSNLSAHFGITTPIQFQIAESPACGENTSAWLEVGLQNWLNTNPFVNQNHSNDEQGTLAGVIRTGTSALAGALVECSCGDAITTDELGRFSLRLDAGSYTITVSKSAYLEKSSSVTIAAGQQTTLDISLEAAPNTEDGISEIDHAFLIQYFGGTLVDAEDYLDSQEGFQEYLDDTGIIYFAAHEYLVPSNQGIADSCGFDILMPPRSEWKRAAALGVMADELRSLINEPIVLRNWWRPPCYNEGVGGAPNGDHPDADALDLDFPSGASRGKAQKYLCDNFWKQDIVNEADIAEGSNLNPRLNMSIGLGGRTIHLGLLSSSGRRYWKYSSYWTVSDSGSCW